MKYLPRSPSNINVTTQGWTKNLWHNPEWNFTSPLPSSRILTYSDHNSADRGTSVVQAMNNPHLKSHSVQDMTWHGMFQGSIMACAENHHGFQAFSKIPVDPPTLPVDLPLGGNHFLKPPFKSLKRQSLTSHNWSPFRHPKVWFYRPI